MTETYKRDFNEIEKQIKFLESEKKSFKIINSNYTTTIDFMNGNKDKYITSPMSKSSFVGYNKIRSDLKKLNIEPEGIFQKYNLTKENKYFDSLQGIEPFQMDKVFNIDLKGAYPQTLLNFNFISNDTFDFLNGLDKKDKLASLGMLASRKVCTTFIDGQPQKMDIVDNYYRNIFFLLVKKVDEIMTKVSNYAGSDFIFFWVDGIYLKPSNEFSVFNIQEDLLKEGYETHFEELENFNLKRSEDKILIDFLKDGNKKEFNFNDKNISFAINNLINTINRKIRK